ncbi:MAG TPA: hypothetical protein VD994_16395 [Prosthecobacter sp.]|nr:hypothetical protein [Prosthecobacter sp.]
MSFASPVLLLVYRRPALTARVLRVLRDVKPAVLLIAADAPGREQDRAACAQTRQLVLETVDWPCHVETRFADRHLGCKTAVSSAIDWAFSLHDRLIVVEDDCVPAASFFRFCDELLARYAEDPRVLQISGSNLTGWRQRPESYHFSRFGPIWGWASWRRAWANYDVAMASWPEVRNSTLLSQLCPEPFEAAWRREIFDEVYHGRIDTWDYQWAYAKMIAGGINIIPATHLVANIGFGAGATHTWAEDDPRGRLPTCDLGFPLVHPQTIATVPEADREYLRKVVGLPAEPWSVPGAKHLLKSWARRIRRQAP